jgi:hypothetical protein
MVFLPARLVRLNAGLGIGAGRINFVTRRFRQEHGALLALHFLTRIPDPV